MARKNQAGCGCCGCGYQSLGINDWTVSTGTKSETAGIKTLNGTFTPTKTINKEAYTIVLKNIDGTFTFTIDSVDYEIDVNGDIITVTADTESRAMDLGLASLYTSSTWVGGSAIHAQIRVTPNHIWVLAARGDGSSITADTSTGVSLTGTLYTIILKQLVSAPSTTWTLAANGDYEEMYVSSSVVEFDGSTVYATKTADCFTAPSIKTSYQAYECCRGPVAYETSDPGYTFPDVGLSDTNYPLNDTHIPWSTYDSFSGSGSQVTAGSVSSGREAFGFGDNLTYSRLNDSGHPSIGYDYTTLTGDIYQVGINGFTQGTNRHDYTQDFFQPGDVQTEFDEPYHRGAFTSVTGSIVIRFPTPDGATPYPLPVYDASLTFSAVILQYSTFQRTTLEFEYDYNSGFTEDETTTEIAINTLGQSTVTLEHTGVSPTTTAYGTAPPTQFTAEMTVYWNINDT